MDQSHGLHPDLPRLVYAGTLGKKHPVRALLMAAEKFHERTAGTAPWSISEGLGAEWLRNNAAGDVVTVLPYQSEEDLP